MMRMRVGMLLPGLLLAVAAPAWAQMQVSVRAYRAGRGFWPWPRTARACGLL